MPHNKLWIILLRSSDSRQHGSDREQIIVSGRTSQHKNEQKKKADGHKLASTRGVNDMVEVGTKLVSRIPTPLVLPFASC